MFDISKLLILAIVALLVVGPKDLPILLRTIGKYMGVVHRHAADFRAQFDEVLREGKLDQIKKDFENVGRETHATMKEGANGIDRHVETARLEVDRALEGPLERRGRIHRRSASRHRSNSS
jgi:sec-independent protein translocase protein TatB